MIIDNPLIHNNPKFNFTFEVDGKYHRTNGPAREFTNGSWDWWINGNRHRYYGPHSVYDSWYIHGKFIK